MTKSNALDRLDELETERSKLAEEARQDILRTIEEGIEQLERLGFSYRLVEHGETNGAHQSSGRSRKVNGNGAANRGKVASLGSNTKRSKRVGKRRTGIRENVLAAISASGKKGMTRGDLITHFQATTDDSYKQSISNALVALKKQKQVKAANGVYRAA